MASALVIAEVAELAIAVAAAQSATGVSSGVVMAAEAVQRAVMAEVADVRTAAATELRAAVSSAAAPEEVGIALPAAGFHFDEAPAEYAIALAPLISNILSSKHTLDHLRMHALLFCPSTSHMESTCGGLTWGGVKETFAVRAPPPPCDAHNARLPSAPGVEGSSTAAAIC